ncbi:hypothetical protein JG687_00002975 [Phytophthora cactorum]|uniref:Uncharacterized protein n=1 Tax=Phytophthora cactorum TaxID=29920 RepID=A0A329S2A6_9STRA|nr:hypothetical protein PC112_g2241 [Phytophthora cactorum]KAG2844685.1 hypothetical protein PC111_g1876 [Phytophthora cactorum]KAG2866943.1 hypothetical protein PC113_g2368 [Phytophthora cactorum]KAG2932134.1 hypothetical protein PC114_g1900 [Phytophthora cactorum]KAG2941908.1 hypothetical protein PC115_g1684 [Phytophthora cactorum]
MFQQRVTTKRRWCVRSQSEDPASDVAHVYAALQAAMCGERSAQRNPREEKAAG